MSTFAMNQSMPLLVFSLGLFFWLCSDAYQKVARVRAAKRIAEGKTAFLNEHGKVIVELAQAAGLALFQGLGGLPSHQCEECNKGPVMLKCGSCKGIFNQPSEPGIAVRCPHCTSNTNHQPH